LNTLNEAGCIATGEALKRFDTEGSAILIGGMKWTSKDEEPNYYQTPYGEVEVLCHVYQTSAGGKTFCPLERDARIVVTSTPRFAKVVAHKFACGGSTQVESDLAENHGRRVARSYLQNLAEAVGSIVQAKEETWLLSDSAPDGTGPYGGYWSEWDLLWCCVKRVTGRRW
jgi:hypothetical protein